MHTSEEGQGSQEGMAMGRAASVPRGRWAQTLPPEPWLLQTEELETLEQHPLAAKRCFFFNV